MKRVGEIKQRREHAFWKQRFVSAASLATQLLTATVRQNGACPGEETSTPSQKVGNQVSVRQTRGADGSGIYIHRESVGKNQSTKQEPECPHCGRWPIHGYGYRLVFISPSMYCRVGASSFFFLAGIHGLVHMDFVLFDFRKPDKQGLLSILVLVRSQCRQAVRPPSSSVERTILRSVSPNEPLLLLLCCIQDMFSCLP